VRTGRLNIVRTAHATSPENWNGFDRLVQQRKTAAFAAVITSTWKTQSSHGLIGTRASSPQADRMSALPVSILGLTRKVNRINSDKIDHHVGLN